MPRSVTQYNVLLSCPSDIKEEIEIVRNTIENFNRLLGDANLIDLKLKHWSTDSYPESGGKPQDLLNNQIVNDSDAAIAIFWTRFGTPTEYFGSGTEEEIEKLISMGKQVFVYFSDCKVIPSEYNSSEYKQIQEFKYKYKDKGIYWSYKDFEEFRKILTNHLTMYFLKLISEDETTIKRNVYSIKINSFLAGKTFEVIKMTHSEFSESKYCYDTKEEIESIVQEIKQIDVSTEIDDIYEENIVSPDSIISTTLNKSNLNFNLFPSTKYILPSKIIESIRKYLSDYSMIELKEDFFYLGNLNEKRNLISNSMFGSSPSKSLEGTENEKLKQKLIIKLYSMIIEHIQVVSYFKYLDSLFWFRGVVSNEGNTFDEDLDITIYIKKGYLVHPQKIEIPGDEIIEMINESFDFFFRTDPTSKIDDFSDYPIKPIKYKPDMSLFKTFEDELEEYKEDFSQNIEDTFIYQIFEENELDVLKFNIKYIKHSSKIHFPSILLFNNIPDEISYEITSKHARNVIKGKLVHD